MLNKNTKTTEQTKCNQNESSKHDLKIYQKILNGMRRSFLRVAIGLLGIIKHPFIWKLLIVYLPEKISVLVGYIKSCISWLSDTFF